MSEFSAGITEGFAKLAGLGGETWIVAGTGATFRGVQINSTGSFEQMTGGTDFKREVHLSCSRDDFAGEYPAKKTVVFRQIAPKVLYQVKEDGSTENDIAPTFKLTLELKHG